MKSQLNLKKALITVLFVIIGVTVFAQTGKISGKVSDKKTGETLIGVTVKIAGTTKGASTDVEGRYIISGLTPGRYILEASYVGYLTKRITEIDVKAQNVSPADFVMEESNSQKLNEVVITATVKQESVNTLYSLQKQSIRISDGISADLIRKSPDKNTSEVLKRVSGTSIQDNKFVVVRGLGDRYNTTLMNNAILPSSEPDKKAFSFDVIPSSLIDNIVISKTGTPDLPGDFAGGAVQIFTKDFPAQKFMSIQVGAGFNTQTTFKNFKRGTKGSTDFLGFDNGDRKLPQAFKDVQKVYFTDAVSPEKRAEVSQSFSNTYGLRDQFKALPTANLQFTFGDTKMLMDDSKFGYIFSVNYRNSTDILFRDRFENNITKFQNFDSKDVLYQSGNSSGAMLNLAYTYGTSKFSFKNFFSNSFSNNYAERSGSYNEGGDITHVKSLQTDVAQNGLFNSVLEGSHNLTENKIAIDYNVSYGYSYRKQPDQRTLEGQRRNDESIYSLTLNPFNNPAVQHAGRVYSDLGENIYGGKVNIAKSYSLFNYNQKVKVGYLTSYRDRSFDITALGYGLNNGTAKAFRFENGVTMENIFSKENIKNNDIVLSFISGSSYNYKGTGFLNAGYLQSENQFTDKLRVIWGARLENYKQEITPTGQPSAKQSYTNTDVLPSVNFTYALTDNSNLRLSGFQSVSRPEMRELADYLVYDYVTDFTVRGNPDLKRALITNIDVRYELFPSAGQIFSISGFYKDFKNPIEQINGGNKDFSFQNAKKATDYGAEIEFRKKLDFISEDGIFKNLTFYVNAAYIKSKVELENSDTNRPLQGQSPYLINGGLQYVNTNGDLSFNLLYNRIGQRLAFAGVRMGTDIYENPRDLIDFQVSKKIIKNKAELRLNVSDIFAQKQMLYQNFDKKTAYSSSEDRVFQSTRPGRSISLNFLYNF